MEKLKTNILYNNNEYSISYFDSINGEQTILFIHWLWCSKNDFINSYSYKKLENFRIICFDFPWCWESNYNENKILTTDDLVEITNNFIKKLNLKNISLIWHILKLFMNTVNLLLKV